MKISRWVLLAAPAWVSVTATPSNATAQLEVGLHGVLADVRDITVGVYASLGGRR